jgi:thioredoxin-like negative regulator of GroEL
VTERLQSLLDRAAEDESARSEFVDLLELLDEADRTDWRRRLSARLF